MYSSYFLPVAKYPPNVPIKTVQVGGSLVLLEKSCGGHYTGPGQWGKCGGVWYVSIGC